MTNNSVPPLFPSICIAFDADTEFCSGVYLPSKTANYTSCFQHSWETVAARERLWACSLSGREIRRIFMSDVKGRVKYKGYADEFDNCNALLITTLIEARENRVEVYALYATSDANFSKKNFVANIHKFNINCESETAAFDGVAINNDHFSSVKEYNLDNTIKRIQVLEDLNTAAGNASSLPLHYSVVWN